jgi:hypothetical protein
MSAMLSDYTQICYTTECYKTVSISNMVSNYADKGFWARGYLVSTVGLYEEMVRE